MGASIRNIVGKDYLKVSETDSQMVGNLKYEIMVEPNDEALVEKLIKLIEAYDNEVLRVRINLLFDGNSNNSINGRDIAEFRAKSIVESINGDGVYFIYLAAAVNFLDVRRSYYCSDERRLREKYLEEAKVSCAKIKKSPDLVMTHILYE